MLFAGEVLSLSFLLLFNTLPVLLRTILSTSIAVVFVPSFYTVTNNRGNIVCLNVFYLFFTGKIEMVKSKWGLALSAVLSVVASLVMASGLCSFFGLVTTLDSWWENSNNSFLTVLARHFLFLLRENLCFQIWLHYRKLSGSPIELSAELVLVEGNIALRFKQWIWRETNMAFFRKNRERSSHLLLSFGS